LLKSRVLPMTVLAARVAYGAALIAAPERLARRWLGRSSNPRPVRLIVAFSDDDAGDLTDIAASAVARNELPDGAAGATALVGGGSALLSALCLIGVCERR